uniref:glutathione transferase n=1 Tax=Bursaphelenchus xylophilus TaxID=6326 RepID=A0A1I7RIW3_BURXY
MVVYKLHYFAARHRAEAIRLMFHYNGTKFEDIRYDLEKWTSVKPTVPFGRLPMLEVDNNKIVQSTAIMRFLARRFGLSGATVFDQARADEACDVILDFDDQIAEFIEIVAKFRAGDEKTAQKEILEPAVDRFFPIFRKFLNENQGTFIAGKRLTYPDFYLADLLFTVRALSPQSFDHYGDLSAYINRIYAMPKLKKYLASRPATVV